MPFRGKRTDQVDFAELRERMVKRQLMGRDITDRYVLDALRSVPRHLFVPDNLAAQAYTDGPLPIGHEQTISQPYIVASMTQHLDIDHDSKVLEVGTGWGYQTAVLAEIAREVFTVELIPELLLRAEENFERMYYRNITARQGDGSLGWPDEAPFDGIIVTAAAQRVPEALLGQLGPTGVMVIPLEGEDDFSQELVKFTRTPEGIEKEFLYHVRFVPLRRATSE